MPIKTVKIHPAIGIARMGNSPTDFFIGPEIPGDHTMPPGGYKDASCRVKRQAAQFRLYGYDEKGAPVKEIPSADADITWTVHLVNRKAATPARNAGIGGAARDGLVVGTRPRALRRPPPGGPFAHGAFQP